MNDEPISEHLITDLERSNLLATWGDTVEPLIRRVVGTGTRRNLLTGAWMGHPAHPAGVIVPLSCWFGATTLDVIGGRRLAGAAQRLVGAGLVSAAPVALAGAADWLDTQGAERRVGTAHAGLNNIATALYLGSWLSRRRNRRVTGVGLGLAATIVTAGAAYLGGHLTYRRGVGVNTTAFMSGPDEWTEIEMSSEPEIGEVVDGEVDGIRLAVARDELGAVHVMESRCTHRGGPLHDGEVHDRCLVCPWHGSEFDLATGAVRKGPASAPQPVYRERRVGDSIQIKRREDGALRSNVIT